MKKSSVCLRSFAVPKGGGYPGAEGPGAADFVNTSNAKHGDLGSQVLKPMPSQVQCTLLGVHEILDCVYLKFIISMSRTFLPSFISVGFCRVLSGSVRFCGVLFLSCFGRLFLA